MPLRFHAFVAALFAAVAVLLYVIQAAPINWLVVAGSGIGAVVLNDLFGPKG